MSDQNTKDTTSVFGIFNRMALPEGATPVADFDINKYVGRWFEIGRMDFFWEKRVMTNVFAEYSPNEEGNIRVVNTGLNEKKQKWSSWEGEARFRGDNTVAGLEVSFFAGIAWAGYNVVSVDEEYKYALVFGRNTDYLWLLSRERGMPQEIKDKYLKMAADCGYDTSKIHWPDQTQELPKEGEVETHG